MAVQLDEQRAILLGPGEGELLAGPKREIYVRYEGPEYEVLEFFCEPGFGPVDPHVHEDHTDSFFILEGEVEFTIGDETFRATPGSFVAAPVGVQHGFRNAGDGELRLLNVHAPNVGFAQRLRRA